MTQQNLLTIDDITVSFAVDEGEHIAVDGVSLSIPYGQTVALVGESGSGKSATALAIMRLLPQPPARLQGKHIYLAGESDETRIDLLTLTDKQMRRVRGSRIAMIFQEPMTSLNPVFTVGQQIVEAILLHRDMNPHDAQREAITQLSRVGIADASRRVDHYPHQLSGGMRQRVMLAMALACQPALLIADEPTTALDVTTQKDILDLIGKLQTETGMSVLFITHDLGIVAERASYTYVMYAGRIVEQGPSKTLLTNPGHPYTKALLACAVQLHATNERLPMIAGSPPTRSHRPTGCPFHPRCDLSSQKASEGMRETIASANNEIGLILADCAASTPNTPSGAPTLKEIAKDHWVACREV